MNQLKKLHEFGQSFWLDYIRRSLITSGELQRLVVEDGLRGVTSNPSIFQKAIEGSTDYNDIINESIKSDPHMDVSALFEELAIDDIQLAADILRPEYEDSDGIDGFVSLELSPHLARDTEGSITEAQRLWRKIKRPNIMLKVPATPEGIPVIEELIGEGINVNATLLFSLSQYEKVANAYLRGLERCSNPQRVASVASFFLSRIDSIVDKELEEIGSPKALKLRGKIAIANAKMAYKRFKELFSDKRWEKLVQKGAQVQRVLWASTSTKNPVYSDVLYVEELIGPLTINTMPPGTITAFRNHGKVESKLEEEIDEAETTLQTLTELGIDLSAITEKLQDDGVDAFTNSYNTLLETLGEKRQSIIEGLKDLRILRLGEYQDKVTERLEYWKEIDFIKRFWQKDPTLWFSKSVPEITDRLGWLNLPEMMHEQLEEFTSFSDEIKNEGIRYIVLLGMGGSSLAPEVFQKIFRNTKGYPELIVLDSTHPSTIREVDEKIDLSHTIFVVSSKSGTTLETLLLFRYFWDKIDQISKERGRHFIAITDPNTPLMDLAKKRSFRRIFQAPPDVGGRYSALTVFGMLPASLIGMDVHKFLDRAWIMSENCAFCSSTHEATGLILAAVLGELTLLGRDKVTFLASSSIRRFPIWLEQLIAESTGKDGKGIVPIVDEPVTLPDNYGSDRLFIYLFSEEDTKDENLVNALEEKGHPIIRINLTDKFNISQEIFSWEMAIAAAGAILGIHPFNQPNVQMAKDLAKKMIIKADKGDLEKEDRETISIEDIDALNSALKGWISKKNKGDYIAIQAYLHPNAVTIKALQKIRLNLLTRLKLATTLGFGPRFLHSTGQLHKGGPNIGLFIQLIDQSNEDLNIPETDYTFNSLIQAQALGDYQALKTMGRRVIRINLKENVVRNLSYLNKLLSKIIYD